MEKKIYWKRDYKLIEFDINDQSIESYQLPQFFSADLLYLNGNIYCVGSNQPLYSFNIKSSNVEQASRLAVAPFRKCQAFVDGNKIIIFQRDEIGNASLLSSFDPETRVITEIPIQKDSEFFKPTINACCHI